MNDMLGCDEFCKVVGASAKVNLNLVAVSVI